MLRNATGASAVQSPTRNHAHRSVQALAQRQSQSLRSASRDTVREAQIAWLDEIVQHTGKSLSAIAAQAGRPGTTLTRFRNDPSYVGILSPAVVQDVSDRWGVPGPGAVSSVGAFHNTSLREDGVPFDTSAKSRLARSVQAWIDDPNISAWTMKSDSLRLAGVVTGDIVIIDARIEARDGDIVCAQIEHGLGARTVFRLYQRPSIVGAAVDALSVRPEIVDGFRVRLAGTAIAIMRAK